MSKTRRRRVGLLLLSAVLLVTIFAGCGRVQAPTEPIINPGPTATQTPPLFFPKHDFPPATDNGGHYFAGKLTLEEGCLLVEVPYNPNDAPWSTRLVVWLSSFSLEEDSGKVRVLDGHGQVVAQVGDHLRLSWAEVEYDGDAYQKLESTLPEHCLPGHIGRILAGGDVTAFDPKNEATELRLSDLEVLFLRQQTVMSVNRGFLDAAGYGELVLEGPCLRIKGEHNTNTVIWPAGFTPYVEGGVVQVRNGAGQIIARVGDEIAGGGGYFKSGNKECPGEAFHIHSIKVLPDVPVYFPRWEEGIRKGQVVKPLTGELTLDGKCLVLRNILEGNVPNDTLLFWPETYALNVENGTVEVLDWAGQAVARVGDLVELNAFNVTYDQAKKYGGLGELSPACSGGYMAVEEISAATKTP